MAIGCLNHTPWNPFEVLNNVGREFKLENERLMGRRMGTNTTWTEEDQHSNSGLIKARKVDEVPSALAPGKALASLGGWGPPPLGCCVPIRLGGPGGADAGVRNRLVRFLRDMLLFNLLFPPPRYKPSKAPALVQGDKMFGAYFKCFHPRQRQKIRNDTPGCAKLVYRTFLPPPQPVWRWVGPRTPCGKGVEPFKAGSQPIRQTGKPMEDLFYSLFRLAV